MKMYKMYKLKSIKSSIKSVIEKIISGNKDWSPEELQIYHNHSEKIERILKKEEKWKRI